MEDISLPTDMDIDVHSLTPSRLVKMAGTSPLCDVKHAMQEMLNLHNMDIRDEWGTTPLMIAAERANLDVLAWLLEKGANPCIHDTDNGFNALHFACGQVDDVDPETRIRRLQCIRLLLEKGAMIDGGSQVSPGMVSGSTPLMLSISMASSKTGITELLLESGASIHSKNQRGESALSLAFRSIRSVDGTYERARMVLHHDLKDLLSLVPGTSRLEEILVTKSRLVENVGQFHDFYEAWKRERLLENVMVSSRVSLAPSL